MGDSGTYSRPAESEVNRAPVTYRSVSQAKQYLVELDGCPHQYYLQRRVRAWQRPAAWFAHGTALHSVVEEIELYDRALTRESAKKRFQEVYLTEINQELERVPNDNFWFSSGPYKGMKDILRRLDVGKTMVDRYFDYIESDLAATESIWRTPVEKRLAVELPFRLDLEGVEVRGYIDQVLWIDKAEEFRVRDIKSGADPGPPFQVKVYGLAIEDTHGIPVPGGDYWMGKTGKPRKRIDLTKISRAEVTDLFHKADEGIKAEDWTPNPSADKCHRCPVATACDFYMPPEE